MAAWQAACNQNIIKRDVFIADTFRLAKDYPIDIGQILFDLLWVDLKPIHSIFDLTYKIVSYKIKSLVICSISGQGWKTAYLRRVQIKGISEIPGNVPWGHRICRSLNIFQHHKWRCNYFSAPWQNAIVKKPVFSEYTTLVKSEPKLFNDAAPVKLVAVWINKQLSFPYIIICIKGNVRIYIVFQEPDVIISGHFNTLNSKNERISICR